MNKIIDENYLDLIIDNMLVRNAESEDGQAIKINDRYSIINVLNPDPYPCELGETYPYHSVPGLFTPMSVLTTEDSGIGSLQNNSHLALYGHGVLVGLVDTGIDYRHPAFLTREGNSRIYSIWDQEDQNGISPEGFGYGTEYTNEDLNLALQSEYPLSIVPCQDTNGHGTAIASIIAGNVMDSASFRGIVTEAELIVVKLKPPKNNLRKLSFVHGDTECYQETDILLGLNYLRQKARELQRPMVICLAMGSSHGGHIGLGTLSDYLSRMVLNPGIDAVIAGGNEGSSRRHYYSRVSDEAYNHIFELEISKQDTLFGMEIWSEIPARLAVKITSPTGETTRFIQPQLGSCYAFDFIFESSRIYVNNITLEKENGDQLIMIRFENPSEGIWRFRLVNLEEEDYAFHAWLPAGDLISEETYFLASSPDTTVTEPGNAEYPLTVTAYNSLSSSTMPESSWGYTRNSRITPDIAAPGYQIACAYPDGRYGYISGTGAAAAHATGTIAMLLEWAVVKGYYPTITGYDVNRLIIRGADRSNHGYTYPNKNWGYGTLDIYSLLRKLNL
ncbi:S8 family peptidase [Faecalicatena contorta]|uniref:S8 family peptidase n=1 Tax=Faecalicatena contorta TaxID=39482 RepID=UPI001FABD40B|nr:S8 family peptidase [Faecalicatena contorta]